MQADSSQLPSIAENRLRGIHKVRFRETVNLGGVNTSTGEELVPLTLAGKLEAFKNQAESRAKSAAVSRGVQSASSTKLESGSIDGRIVTKAPKLKEKTFIGGIEIEAHNRALRGAYIASLNNDNREAISGIALENGNDLIAFNEAASSYREAVVGNVDPVARQAVDQDLDSKITSARIRIQATQMREQRIDANAERKLNITTASEASAIAARNGDSLTSSEAIADAFRTIDSMVDSDDLSVDKAGSMKREIEREAAEQSIRKTFDDIVDADGFQEAFDELEGKSKKIPRGWTPDEWDDFIADQQRDLNRKLNRSRQLERVELKNNEKSLSVERGGLFNNPDIPANPAKGGQDRKDVNAFYESKFIERPFQGNEQQLVNETVSFIENTGIVPDVVISNIGASMRSGNPEQVVLMSDMVARIAELPKSANALKDLPDESRAIALQVSDSIRLGIDAESSVEIARKNTFGLSEQRKEAIKLSSQNARSESKRFLRDNLEDFSDAEFSGGFLSSIPFFGGAPDIPVSMQADFNVSFEKFMTLTDGNVDQALKLSKENIKKTWAVSNFDEDGGFMRNSPEALHGVKGFDNEWMLNQFIDEMDGSGIVDAKLVENADTARTGSYSLIKTNPDGIVDIVMREDGSGPMLWAPDITISPEYIDLVAAPQNNIARAKSIRTKNRKKRAALNARKVMRRVFSGEAIPLGDREDCLASPEGKIGSTSAIANLYATGKVSEIEGGELSKAFGVEGELNELRERFR